MSSWLREVFGRRPWWMNALLVFCWFMAVLYEPWDVFVKPVALDQEVWFGILFTGWQAKIAALPHWAIYAAGAYGFWRMRSWMWPWAALYTAEVAFSLFVWSVMRFGGWKGWVAAPLACAPFAALALALWHSRDHFGRRRRPLKARYGDWALVTGASAGLGTEFARALAAEGLSCVLTARREDRLRDLAAELEKNHRVSTRVVAADLSTVDGADRLAEAVGDLPIAVLVNNAGFGYAGRFEKLEAERLRAMIQVNCTAPVLLTRRLLPAMRERGKGAVIITGSVAGRQPLPFHGLYAATKAFDQFLGESLWAELRGSGIDVLVLEPGPTATEFFEVAGETREAGEPPRGVVELALDSLGRQPSVVSGWFNYLRANLARVFPRPVTVLVAEGVVRRNTPEAMQ
jgi:short-subunit dehydrogenase